MTPAALARKLAVEAGRYLRKHQPGRREISFKGGAGNLVTDMDRASEEMIVGAIRRAFPSHAIVAEEGGGTQRESTHRWFVDPLDGTTNYAHGFPIYCVSIALEVRGRVELGVVYAPVLDELFVAERGRGATRNGRPIRVSGTRELDRAFVCTGFPYEMKYKIENCRYWTEFIKVTQAVRRIGSAAVDLCWTAAGIYDGFWEYRLGPWDIAAGVLIAEEAGAKVTDYRGGPVGLFTGEVLAANARLHPQMMRVIKKVTGRR